MRILSRPAGAYQLINLILAGMVIAIFAYSGFFSADTREYPIQCVHQAVNGIPCPSCGLSHSFSSIVRGDLEAARQFNNNGPALFLFFILQLVLRVSNFAAIRLRPGIARPLARFDIILSAVAFLLAFMPFIRYNAALVISWF